MSHLSPRLTTADDRRRQLDLMFGFLEAGPVRLDAIQK
jgi:hypothetical protein